MPSPRSRNTLLRRFSNFTGLSPAATLPLYSVADLPIYSAATLCRFAPPPPSPCSTIHRLHLVPISCRGQRHPETALGVSERGYCGNGGGGGWNGDGSAAVSYSWVRARGDCGGGWNGDTDEIDLGRHHEQELTHLDPLSLTLNPLCLTDLKNDQGHIGHNTHDFVC
uniref:Uncharacterized protein n=1 Tax=Oryza nivara TaxID=4536 RepID=A0A0E0HL78_ORYNI